MSFKETLKRVQGLLYVKTGLEVCEKKTMSASDINYQALIVYKRHSEAVVLKDAKFTLELLMKSTQGPTYYDVIEVW